MLILAIETTGPYASVALTDGERVSLIKNDDNYSHLQRISGMVLEILKKEGLEASVLDAIAVSRGPGSFTGLRIGMATAKGFAQIWNKPIVEVPTLDSFAYTAMETEDNTLICPIFDARRSQVYGAAFRRIVTGKETAVRVNTLVPEGAYGIDEYLSLVKASMKEGDRLCFFGDGVKPYLEVIEGSGLSFEIAPEEFALQTADNTARLGVKLYNNGILKDCFTAQPEYLRLAEAERKLKEKKAQ